MERCALIVDDEPLVQNALARALRSAGLDVLRAGDAETALAVLAERRPALVIADHGLPGRSGIDLLEQMRREHPETRRVLLTGRRDFALVREAINRAGVAWFLPKPWDPEAIAGLLEACLAQAAPGLPPAPSCDDAAFAAVLAGLPACDDVSSVVAEVGRACASLGPLRELWWVDEERETLLALAGGIAPLDERALAALDPATASLLGAARALRRCALMEGELLAPDGGAAKTLLLALPVQRRGRALGLLGLVAGRGDAFPPERLRWLERLTAPVAAAIERVRLAAYLADEKALWESAFDAIADPVLLLDGRFRLLRANRAAREAGGIAACDIDSPTCHDVACIQRGVEPPHDEADCPLQDPSALVSERRLERADLFGRRGHVFASASFPLAVRPGAPPRVVQIHRDVTSERRLAEELRRSEQLSVVGSLAAGVAHEIRNPLAAMTQAASLLRGHPGLGPEDRRLVEILLDETRRMDRLVGGFLAFARPSTDGLAPTGLEQLVGDTLALARRDPLLAGSRVELEPPASPLPTVLLDADRIRQVLWNLLRNAAEASPQGCDVTLSLGAQRDAGRDGVWVAVRDHGPGIAAQDRERVFLPFETTRPGGTGLGLALARHILGLHQGWIRAEAAPGGGACVRFWLPCDGPARGEDA